MKVAIGVRDPLLRRALTDLLRAHGHEAIPPEVGFDDCRLRILSEEEIDGGVLSHCATLVLAHRDLGETTDPRSALEEALAARGVCSWPPPFNAGLLLDVLAESASAAAKEPAPAPDLADAPHPWLLVDPDGGRIVGANEEARMLLDLGPADAHRSLADVALPGALRDGLGRHSQGSFPLGSVGQGRWAAWWTDRRGRRVVCLMHVPDGDAVSTRHDHLLAEIGRMTSTLAHEIRNPIASIAGAFDLLESETDPTDRAEVLKMARERLAQMSRLLEQTLLLARPIDEPPEIVDLGTLIESAVSAARLDPRFEQIVIRVRDSDAPVQVRAHSEPLRGALSNVLINAAQAQEGRGEIRLSLTTDSRRALIHVRDAGPGVPRERREEVFRPFYTTKESGTGLGLAEVRRAIEAAGGAVSVEDAETGACFRLELPLVRQA